MSSTRVTRRHLGAALAAVVAAFAVAPRQADAAITLSLTDNLGDPSVVVSQRGGSFTVNVTLTTDQPFTGLSFFLIAPGNGSTQFSITGRTTAAGNPLTEKISSDGEIVATNSALLDPDNDSDLGYFAANVFTNIPAGTYSIGTLTLASSPSISAIPMPYTIGVTNARLSDASFAEYEFPGGSYSVYAPEPTTLAMIAAVGAIATIRRRRTLRA